MHAAGAAHRGGGGGLLRVLLPVLLAARGSASSFRPLGYKCIDIFDEKQYPFGEGHLEVCIERNECVDVMVHWLGAVRAVNSRGRSFMAWEHQGCKGMSHLYSRNIRMRQASQIAWSNGIGSFSYVFDEEDEPPRFAGRQGESQGLVEEVGAGRGDNLTTTATPTTTPASNATGQPPAAPATLASTRYGQQGTADGSGFYCVEVFDNPAMQGQPLVMCAELNECVNVMANWLGRVREVRVGEAGGSFQLWERQGCKGESLILRGSLGPSRSQWGNGRVSSIRLRSGNSSGGGQCGL